MLQTMTAIALGGAVGALMRYGIARWASQAVLVLSHGAPILFPWGTFTANIIGALLLGFLFQLFLIRSWGSEPLRLLLTTGFLGALTTFSTFALEGFTLVQSGALQAAIIYILVTNVAGLVAIFFGMRLAGLFFSG